MLDTDFRDTTTVARHAIAAGSILYAAKESAKRAALGIPEPPDPTQLSIYELVRTAYQYWHMGPPESDDEEAEDAAFFAYMEIFDRFVSEALSRTPASAEDYYALLILACHGDVVQGTTLHDRFCAANVPETAQALLPEGGRH